MAVRVAQICLFSRCLVLCIAEFRSFACSRDVWSCLLLNLDLLCFTCIGMNSIACVVVFTKMNVLVLRYQCRATAGMHSFIQMLSMFCL